MKTAVYGCGISGEAAARLSIELGDETAVFDDNMAAAEKLSKKLGVKIHNNITDIVLYDRIVVSPKAFFSEKFRMLRGCREIISEIDFAYANSRCRIAAVTGSNGKTTVTKMVSEILTCAGVRAVAVGNIGVPFSAECRKLGENDVAVTELSSYQLAASRIFHAEAGALLNITPDHLDVHRSFEDYMTQKKKVFMNMMPSDRAVMNAHDGRTAVKTVAEKVFFSAYGEKAEAVLKGGTLYYCGEKIINRTDMKLSGLFNMENALAAICLSAAFGVGKECMAQALADFVPDAHRMEVCGEAGGVRFVDDSKATNPAAALAAVENTGGRLAVILGGSRKNTDFTELVRGIKRKGAYVLLYGECASEIAETAEKCGYREFIEVRDVGEGAEKGYEILKEGGGTVLLSPACASFDMYADYGERGEEFKRAVEKLRRNG